MRASTYTILMDVWAFPFGTVILPAPMAYLSAVQKLADNTALFRLMAVAWIVLSTLVLAWPRASDLFVERVIRSIAWLILLKYLFVLCQIGFIR